MGGEENRDSALSLRTRSEVGGGSCDGQERWLCSVKDTLLSSEWQSRYLVLLYLNNDARGFLCLDNHNSHWLEVSAADARQSCVLYQLSVRGSGERSLCNQKLKGNRYVLIIEQDGEKVVGNEQPKSESSKASQTSRKEKAMLKKNILPTPSQPQLGALTEKQCGPIELVGTTQAQISSSIQTRKRPLTKGLSKPGTPASLAKTERKR